MTAPTETRERVSQTIAAYPGVHLRELARQTELSESLVGYHVSNLIVEGLILAEDDGHYLRLYSTHGRRLSPRQRALIGVLRKPIPLRMVLLLLEESPRLHTDFLQELGVAKSTVTYHMGKLVDAGMARATDRGLALVNPGAVRRLLAAWQPSQGMADRFEATWSQLYAQQASPARPKARAEPAADHFLGGRSTR